MTDAARLYAFEKGAATRAPLVEMDVQRVLDVSMAVLALIVLAPMLLAIGLAVWASDGGPILFGQTRVGRQGRTFTCWKFRSMVVDSDARLRAHLAADPAAQVEWARDHKLRDDPRITPFGRFLRASSLDELPQLWNVLAGEMSLVGPRPIVPAEIVRYSYHFPDYCSCRPGLTGLWQVSGRNDVSYDKRVALDVQYVRNRSLGLYVAIVVRTIPSVMARRGSY